MKNLTWSKQILRKLRKIYAKKICVRTPKFWVVNLSRELRIQAMWRFLKNFGIFTFNMFFSASTFSKGHTCSLWEFSFEKIFCGKKSAINYKRNIWSEIGLLIGYLQAKRTLIRVFPPLKISSLHVRRFWNYLAFRGKKWYNN